jgi:hypothetical protein
MSDTDIHSCGYYCDRPACLKAQRDELRDKLFEGQAVKTYSGGKPNYTQPIEKETAYQKGYNDAMGWKTQNHLEHLPTNKEWVGLTDDEIAEVFGDYMDSLDNGEEDENWGYERLLEAAIKEKNT